MTRSDSPPSISTALQSILSRLYDSLISPNSSCRLAVADSGATDHMLPDKSAFISYKSTSNLKVRMGNNSSLPVLGRGSAIIFLNGQRVLVRNALHLLCRFIVFEPTFNSRAAVFLTQMMPVCWCTSLPLCFRLTPPPIGLYPMSLWVGRPHFRHFTMFNLGVVLPSTLQNLVHLPTRSPCLRL